MISHGQINRNLDNMPDWLKLVIGLIIGGLILVNIIIGML